MERRWSHCQVTPFNGGDKPYQGSLIGVCLSKHCCLCGHTSLIVFDLNPGFKSKPNLPAALRVDVSPYSVGSCVGSQASAWQLPSLIPATSYLLSLSLRLLWLWWRLPKKTSHVFFHENIFLCGRKRKNWVGTFGPPEVLPLSLLLFFEACSVRFGNVSVRKTALIPARTAARVGKKKSFCLLCLQNENVAFSC